jgi:hypothetical protein
MTINCFDFDTGQPRHFPEGTYRQQVAAVFGQAELDIMRLLRRCWLLFKHKEMSDWDLDDQEFASWLLAKKKPIDDTDLNRIMRYTWLRQAV